MTPDPRAHLPSGRRGSGEEWTTLVVTDPSAPIFPDTSSRWRIERAVTLREGFAYETGEGLERSAPDRLTAPVDARDCGC